MNNHLLTFFGIAAACLLAIAFQLIFFSPSSIPGALQSCLPSNGKLQEVIKLGEGLLKQPEDITIDKNGVLYTATRDGYIKKLHKNGTWEDLWHIDSEGLLGLTTTASSDIIVCDIEKGLLKIGEDGVTVLASNRFADAVIEASDGTLYFSVVSTKFNFHNWQLEWIEAKPRGQLLKYEPSSNVASVVLDDLAFANGVALSPDQDYLVVCETWKYRCLKYWLRGDLTGQTEIFVDNLPGRPDNINLAPDGSYWIALIELNIRMPEFLYTSQLSSYMLRAYPGLGKWMVSFKKKAMVVNVGSDGKITKCLDDPNGKVMEFVTSALEFDGHLYIGSLQNEFIGKLPLTA